MYKSSVLLSSCFHLVGSSSRPFVCMQEPAVRQHLTSGVVKGGGEGVTTSQLCSRPFQKSKSV